MLTMALSCGIVRPMVTNKYLDMKYLKTLAEDKKKDVEFIKRLIKNGGVNKRYKELAVHSGSKEGEYPLCFACHHNDFSAIKFLLESKADPNAEASFDGLTPLYEACLGDNIEAIKLLLAYGANVNVPVESPWWDKAHQNLLQFACKGNKILEKLKLLLSKQAIIPDFDPRLLLARPVLMEPFDQRGKDLGDLLDMVWYLTNLQQVNQQQVDKLMQAPGKFIVLFFRDGLMPKIMGCLTTEQKNRLVKAFFENLRGDDKGTYLFDDMVRVARQLKKYVTYDVWWDEVARMDKEFQTAILRQSVVEHNVMESLEKKQLVDVGIECQDF